MREARNKNSFNSGLWRKLIPLHAGPNYALLLLPALQNVPDESGFQTPFMGLEYCSTAIHRRVQSVHKTATSRCTKYIKPGNFPHNMPCSPTEGQGLTHGQRRVNPVGECDQ